MKYGSFILALSLAASGAYAKTDVKAAMRQIKENEENAKANQKQYETNVNITNQNIAEINKAIKKLREQRQRLNANSANLQKNQAILDAMKERLNQFKAEEMAAMKKDNAQIAELRAMIEKLEANKAKRLENVNAYNQKIAEVEKEKADWDRQREAFAGIQKELDEKEKKALAEREKWVAKRKGYQTEALKWKKEAEVAEQTRVKFDKLAD